VHDSRIRESIDLNIRKVEQELEELKKPWISVHSRRSQWY